MSEDVDGSWRGRNVHNSIGQGNDLERGKTLTAGEGNP